MTIEPNSDTECLKQEDCFSADDFISQSINEGLFIAQRNSLGDRDQKITENHTFPNSSTSSEVEYTLTFDCSLNDFSSDHTPQPNFNAKAKYSMSFECGDGTCSAGENCPKDFLKIN